MVQAVVQPINYSADVKQPFEQSVSGFDQGMGMRQALDQQQIREMAINQAKAQQKDVNALAVDPNPTAEKYAAIMTKYPAMSEHFKRGWDVLNTDQQQTKLGQATQVYAALHANQPDVAVGILTDQATALRNSGNEKDAKAAEMMAKFIQTSPDSAKTSIGLMLSSLAGPDKFAETFAKLQGEGRTAELQPDVKRKTAAEADTAQIGTGTALETQRKTAADADLAEITARYGEKNAITDLAKKGWDIKNIESEIVGRKETNRIAAINAAINGANSATEKGRLGLERDKFIAEQGQKVRDRVADVTQARNTIDNMLNSADQVLKHPGLEKATGSVMGGKWFPTLRQDSADFNALIENLTSQEFSSQVATMKGMGSLSNAEGEKLATALQSLRTTQSPEQLTANVKEAQRIMLKARANLVTRYGVPDTIPDTPAAAKPGQNSIAKANGGGSKEIDDLVKKYAP